MSNWTIFKILNEFIQPIKENLELDMQLKLEVHKALIKKEMEKAMMT